MIKQPLTLFLLFFFSFVNAQNIALKQELKALLDKKNDSSYLNTFLENANNKNTNAIDKIEYQAAYVNLLVALAKYDKAMQFSKENLAKYEKENLPYGKAIFNNLVAICYYYLTNRKEAIFYFLKSYDLCKQFGFIESQSLLANNLGAMSIEENDYPLAKKYLIESRNLFQKHHEKLKNYGGITLRLLGQVYEHENDLIAAEKIYDEVHVYCTNIKDSSGLAINYGCLSRIYMKTNRAAKAFETNKLSLKCADALNKRDIVIATRQMYIENLEKAGNFKQALYFQKQIDTLTQKYFTQETSTKLSEAEIKYKTATLRFENEKSIAKNKEQKVIFILISIAIIAFGLLLFYNKTQKIKAQQKLNYEQQKTELIVNSEQKERVRIARELHDGVGQTMAAVSMNLEVLKSNFIVEQEALVIYNKTKNLLDNSIDDIRNISHSMVSSTLFHSGLVFAIKEFVDKMVLPQNISITYNLENYTTTQPIEVESSLLRIIQESVNNSIKHAKASFIHIELLNNLEHQINLVIADNGIGFNKEKNQNGIGINNIEARAQSLKGKVVIESNKTMGTKLFIQIPLIQIVANG